MLWVFPFWAKSFSFLPWPLLFGWLSYIFIRSNSILYKIEGTSSDQFPEEPAISGRGQHVTSNPFFYSTIATVGVFFLKKRRGQLAQFRVWNIFSLFLLIHYTQGKRFYLSCFYFSSYFLFHFSLTVLLLLGRWWFSY